MANTIVITKLENGNVRIDDSSIVKTGITLQPNLHVNPRGDGERIDVLWNKNEALGTFSVDDVLKVVRQDGTEVFIVDFATLYSELINYFFFDDTKIRLDHLESIIYEIDYKETIDISVQTTGSIIIPDGGEVDTTEYVGNSLLSTETAGKLDFKVPKVGIVEITSSLDVNGNWTVTDTYPDPVAIVYRLRISGKDYFNLDLDKVVNFFLIGTDGGGGITAVFEEKTFDVTNQTLPITANNDTTHLNVNFFNFDQDLDLTGNLPINLQSGSKVVLRKTETNQFKLSYNDGIVNYNFVDRNGDYLTLFWTGSKYTI